MLTSLGLGLAEFLLKLAIQHFIAKTGYENTLTKVLNHVNSYKPENNPSPADLRKPSEPWLK